MINLDRRLLENFDWVTFGTVLFISVAGIMTIYSATRPLSGGEHSTFYIKQIYWLIIALAGMAFTVGVDYNNIGKYSTRIYIIGIILLLVVLVTGRIGMGARRWISIGPLNFQPSEFFKLAVIIMISFRLSLKQGALSLRDIGYFFGIFILIPFLLVLKQPDLGTSAVILALFFSLALVKGIQKYALVLVIAISLISVPFIGTIAWDVKASAITSTSPRWPSGPARLPARVISKAHRALSAFCRKNIQTLFSRSSPKNGGSSGPSYFWPLISH
jgi:rod shape determining protein RodA